METGFRGRGWTPKGQGLGSPGEKEGKALEEVRRTCSLLKRMLCIVHPQDLAMFGKTSCPLRVPPHGADCDPQGEGTEQPKNLYA